MIISCTVVRLVGVQLLLFFTLKNRNLTIRPTLCRDWSGVWRYESTVGKSELLSQLTFFVYNTIRSDTINAFEEVEL